DAPVRVERVPQLALWRAGDCRRPVGLRELAGVGHQLPAAAAQLLRTAPNPFRAPGFRAALSTHDRADAGRITHRQTSDLGGVGGKYGAGSGLIGCRTPAPRSPY